MKANLRDFHSPDADLETFVPEDPTDVEVLVQMMAGPADGPGDESFDVVVISVTALGRLVHSRGPIIGRHYLIVREWAWPKVKRYLMDQVETVEGLTWSDIAPRLGRIGRWEFEDYMPKV
jgi:hypothetical protein